MYPKTRTDKATEIMIQFTWSLWIVAAHKNLENTSSYSFICRNKGLTEWNGGRNCELSRGVW